MAKPAELAFVGNDVVDFKEARWTSEHTPRHIERFHLRVFTPEERAQIARAREPERARWAFFAAKEAAFKVVTKLEPSVVFAHQAFVVAPALDEVRYAGLRMHLELSMRPAYVHASAWLGANEPCWCVRSIARGEHASRAARRLGSRILARRLGCSPSGVRIVRSANPAFWDGRGPPHAVLENGRASFDLSLSHHGCFVAFSAILEL